MLNTVRESWTKEFLALRQSLHRVEWPLIFEGLTAEQASRAAYFTAMASLIERLGLANPHEKSALSIEPTHPIPSTHLGGAIASLTIDPALPLAWAQSKLSLISLPMLERYTGSRSISEMRRSGLIAPLHLLDPLYGFTFFKLKDGLHNHCLAIDLWSSHLSTMPRSLAKELWSNRPDSMLSGGALAGRLLFQELLPPESDPLKRVNVPELQADTEGELLDLVQRLIACADTDTNIQLWFRGQVTDYQTPDRAKLAMRGIAPYSNIRESDLTPSLYRNYDIFLKNADSYEEMVVELAEWVHVARAAIPNGLHRSPPTVTSKGVAAPTNDGLSSYQRGLLLQQYGAPSAYVDITSDVAIAAWFATHQCSFDAEGKMTFQRFQWRDKARDQWPTVFVFPLVRGLHPYLDLDSILTGSDALRPQRQKCGLLGGAGNLARNYCARYVGLKIRLAPGFALASSFQAAHLFPPSSEDKVLETLKAEGLGGHGRKFVLTELATA